MKTYYDILEKADISTFEKWKYDLRQHGLTAEVVNLLDGVPQGTKYHPEFDALKHTYYVVKSVLEFTVTPDSLLEAAFLHDVGKAFTTNVGKDRIYHFGHPKKSAEFVEKHKDKILFYDITYRIVKDHMDLPLGHKKLNDDIDMKSFTYFDKVLSKKLYMKESNKVGRLINRMKAKTVMLKQEFSGKKLYVLVGIAGSGKSTYIKKHFKEKWVVCPDEIRRHFFGGVDDQDHNKEVFEIAKDMLKLRLEVYGRAVLDATNVNKWLRIEFMSAFNGSKKIAVVFDVDPEVAIERVSGDISKGVDRSDVPEHVIRKQYKLFQKGLKSLQHEFNRVIYVR